MSRRGIFHKSAINLLLRASLLFRAGYIQKNGHILKGAKNVTESYFSGVAGFVFSQITGHVIEFNIIDDHIIRPSRIFISRPGPDAIV